MDGFADFPEIAGAEGNLLIPRALEKKPFFELAGVGPADGPSDTGKMLDFLGTIVDTGKLTGVLLGIELKIEELVTFPAVKEGMNTIG